MSGLKFSGDQQMLMRTALGLGLQKVNIPNSDGGLIYTN